MNERGVLTARQELLDHHFEEYRPIPAEGVWLLRLDFKAWNKRRNRCLICYFSAEDGKKYKLYTWKQRSGMYGPYRCRYDFSYIRDYSWWKCTIKTASSGYRSWVDAEPVIRHGMTVFWHDC